MKHKSGHDVGDSKETFAPEDDGLKDQAERLAASLEPLRANHLFRGEPPKLLSTAEPRVDPHPPPLAEPDETSVRPLVILLALIVAFIAAMFLATFSLGASR